ncbi:MAG: alpha/beta fold hydrolase [Myxococcota bacterium]
MHQRYLTPLAALLLTAGCSGNLSVERVGPKPAAGGQVVLLLHGYGASGDDLVGLAKEVASALPSTTFWMPAGPHRVGMGGRSWVPQFSAPSRAEYQKRLIVEAEDTRTKLWRLVEDARASGVECKDIFVGGFSLGGRMALELAARAPDDCVLGGLIVMSGGGMDELDLPETGARTRVLVTQGKADSVVPLQKGLATARALAKRGDPVEWLQFEGAHQIPPAVRQALAPFLRGEAAGTAVP